MAYNTSEQEQSQLGPPAHATISSSVSGTSAVFIALIIVSATLPTVFRDVLSVLHPGWNVFSRNNFWVCLATDLLTVVLPVELMLTVLNNQLPYVFVITGTLIAVPVMQLFVKKKHIVVASSQAWNVPMKNGTPAITYFRAFTNIFTAFSILAVDFPALFPSYFSKSRIYGTTLMDAGLGFFMISNAVVSPEARGLVQKDGLALSVFRICTETIPLVVLGVLRYCINGLVDYSVSPQEYGVHWNFFFTLAVVKMSSSLLFRLLPQKLWCCLGPGIILVYQYFLSTSRLKLLILFGTHGDASRVGFLDANREGLFSSLGHLAVYLTGVQLGSLLMRRRETIWDWCLVAIQLTTMCLCSYTLLQLSWKYIQMPSRRFANLAYLLFIIFVTTLQIVRGLLVDILMTYIRHLKSTGGLIGETSETEIRQQSCGLLHAVNYNGLVYFLAANLLTGSVNLSLPTRSISQLPAFCVVSLYMFTLSGLFSYLYSRNISLKRWLTKHVK